MGSYFSKQYYWGMYSSIYHTLEKKDIDLLETAVRATLLGNYATAVDIFDNSLPDYSYYPVLALEFANLCERIGREDLRAEALGKALEAVGDIPNKEAYADWQLLRIQHADAEIYACGKLKEALAAARLFQEWLKNVAVDDYTELHVECLLTYHAIIKIVRNNSNWAEERDGRIPEIENDAVNSVEDIPPSKFHRQAEVLTKVRRKLQSPDRVMLVYRIARTEVSLYDGSFCLLPYKEFFELAGYIESTGFEPLLIKLATNRLFYAHELAILGSKTEAESEIQEAIRLIKKANCSEEEPEIYNPRAFLLIQRTYLEINRPESLVDQYNEVIKAHNTAAELNDLTIQRVFIRSMVNITESLKSLYWEGEDDENRASEMRTLFVSTLEQYLWFEENMTESAYFLSTALITILFELAYRSEENLQALEYLSNFETKYPDFNIPYVSERLFGHGFKLSQKLADENLNAEYAAKYQIALENCPFTKRSVQGVVELGDPDGEDWQREWSMSPELGRLEHKSHLNSHSDEYWLSMRLTSMKVLIRWVRAEYRAQNLDKTELIRILKLPSILDDQNSKASFDNMFLNIKPEELCDVIYGTTTDLTDQESWNSWLEPVEKWLRAEKRVPTIQQRHHLLKWIQKSRVQILTMAMRNRSQDSDLIILRQKARQKLIDILFSIDDSASSKQERTVEEKQFYTDIVLLSTCPDAITRNLITDDMLYQAQEGLELVIQRFRDENQLQFLYMAQASLTRLLWQRNHHFKSIPKIAGLPLFWDNEKILRTLRQENSNLQGSRSLIANSTFAERSDMEQHYNDALKTSLAAWTDWIEARRARRITSDLVAVLPQALRKTFFDWIQRSKARSLTDILGLDAKLPAGLLASVEADPEARSHLEREDSLLSDIREAIAVADKINLRHELVIHRAKMHAIPALRPVLDIREGTAISLEEMGKMGSDFGDNVVFVDWVKVSWTKFTCDLSTVIYRKGFVQQVAPCKDILLKDVITWAEEQLDAAVPLSRSSSARQLRALKPLITNLLNYTDPGEILVFCPTRELHRIPLHAIEINGKPLIERNPIVYCQSLSILRYCQLSIASSVEVEVPTEKPEAVILSPLNELNARSSDLDELAEILEARVLPEDLCRKSELPKIFRTASLIHFHGHVRFEEDNPLQHRLELSADPQGPDDILTADDIFDLRFRKPAHVTTIGCWSGRAKVTNCDDLLGLTTALHYAGASSVISALWPIHRDDGAAFSRHFYKEIARVVTEEGNGGSGFVNFALAMQKAVLAVRKSDDGQIRNPYHWAGFVFNGAWMFPKRDIPLAGSA